MADRQTEKCEAIQKRVTKLHGYFTIDGAGAITAQTPAAGLIATVSKPAGTGIYRVTLADKWNDILFADANAVKAAGTFNGDIMPVAVNKTAWYVEFQARQTSDGAALAIASCDIYWEITCKNSSEGP